ncbi:hypothetical protein [Gordonia asplenii]|nr:hypothetical protein [Gordonia asplenii]
MPVSSERRQLECAVLSESKCAVLSERRQLECAVLSERSESK